MRRATILLLLPGLALAGQLLQGDQVRIYYGDGGLWNDPDTGVEAGLQFYDTGQARWMDITWPGTPWSAVFIGYTQGGTDHTSLNSATEPDWSVDEATDTAVGDRLIALHRFTTGDLQIDRMESLHTGGQAIWTQWTLTNTGTAAISNLRLTQSIDPDPDSSALVNPQPLTHNDTLDLDLDGLDDWVQSEGVTTGVSVGFGACDAGAQDLGHHASNTFLEDPDLTLTDEGGTLQDYTMNIRHTLTALAPGASVTFSTVTAMGHTATGAQNAYLDAMPEACGILDFDRDNDGYDSIDEGGDDCDDANADIHPGAKEVYYDGVDANCDGNDDDADEDGFAGNGESDCDDANADVNPGAKEVWYDGTDQDCDGNDNDADSDGFAGNGGRDCADDNAAVNPGAQEVWDDGPDQAWAGNDDDADGVSDRIDTDCDDADTDIHPAAKEVWYDGTDQDCSGDSDYDADGDSHDHEDYGGEDCDDYSIDVTPDIGEVYYDGVDADCSGDSDYDADGDGHDAAKFNGDDCADTDPARWRCQGDLYGGGGARCASVSASHSLLLVLLARIVGCLRRSGHPPAARSASRWPLPWDRGWRR